MKMDAFYTPSFLCMEDIVFDFLYFALGILHSHLLKQDSFHQVLDT